MKDFNFSNELVAKLRCSGWTEEDFQKYFPEYLRSDLSALSPSDPALSQAKERLEEIRLNQRHLNKQKNALSRETKKLLKLYPSLRK